MSRTEVLVPNVLLNLRNHLPLQPAANEAGAELDAAPQSRTPEGSNRLAATLRALIEQSEQELANARAGESAGADGTDGYERTKRRWEGSRQQALLHDDLKREYGSRVQEFHARFLATEVQVKDVATHEWQTWNGQRVLEVVEDLLSPGPRTGPQGLGPNGRSMGGDPSINGGAENPPVTDGGDSHYDFFDELLELLEALQGEWLDAHEEVLSKYVAFFEKLTKIMAMFADAIRGTNDDGELEVWTLDIREALEELMNGDLGLGGGFASEAEAKEFLDKLGLEGLEAVQDPDGGWQVQVKKSVVQDLLDAIPPLGIEFDIPWPKADFPVDISPARWNAIVAAKDALMERFNHISRVLTEKYQRTLQLWDTLNKTLSGSIDAIAEADRIFASNLT